MSSEDLDPALVSEIQELRQGRIREAGPNEILQVVQTIIDGMNKNIPATDVALRSDLEDRNGSFEQGRIMLKRNLFLRLLGSIQCSVAAKFP